MATNNASTTMDASLSLSVAAGTYYLQIDGVGTGDPTTGYSDYASLGQYTISGTVPAAGTNRPPTASATATPASGTAPLAVTFSSAGSSDPDGTIASYSWSFGDGGKATGATVSHTYTTAGTYTATLVVTDNGGLTGNATVTVTVSQAANKAPIAIVSATPTSGNAPLAVSFSSSGSHDPDGSISTYSWNFGDGGTATGSTVSHTYNAAGTYTARLTVTDNRGATGSATVTIRVTQAKVVRVRSIVLSVVNDAGSAVVTITDADNVVRSGATVTGMWSGIITGSATGTTGTNGTVTLASVSTRRRGTITFTVTGVTASGYVYNAAQNLQTSASVTKTK